MFDLYVKFRSLAYFEISDPLINDVDIKGILFVINYDYNSKYYYSVFVILTIPFHCWFS